MTALDTNILIYACDTADPVKQEKALQAIETAADGVVLWQVACEFLAASRKLAAQGFTPDQAWARLGDFLHLFPLILPGSGVLDQARALHVGRGLSFWDAMVVAACLECGAERLLWEDIPSAPRLDSLEILNPFA